LPSIVLATSRCHAVGLLTCTPATTTLTFELVWIFVESQSNDYSALQPTNYPTLVRTCLTR